MRIKKIFITDYIPSLNKGEAAILYGMIATFKRFLDLQEVYLWSNNPLIDKQRVESEVKIIDARTLGLNNSSSLLKVIKFAIVLVRYLLFIFFYTVFGKYSRIIMRHEVWKTYSSADLVIIAHDDTLAASGFSYSCVLNAMVCFFLKKPCVIYAVSMGPYKNNIHKILTKILFSKLKLLTFREELSYQNCRKIINKHPNMHVTMDPAFLLEPSSPERINELMIKESISKDYSPLIGLTVTCGSPVYEKAFKRLAGVKDKYNRHAEIISKVIAYLTGELKAEVILVPHVIGPQQEKDDRIIAKDIFQKIGDKVKVKIITSEYSPAEIKGLIGRFDFFIGERLHSVFNAVSMGVPSVAISFPADYRAYGIIGKALNEERLLYNIEYLEYGSLLGKINEIWGIREQVKKDLLFKIPDIKAMAWLNGELICNLESNEIFER